MELCIPLQKRISSGQKLDIPVYTGMYLHTCTLRQAYIGTLPLTNQLDALHLQVLSRRSLGKRGLGRRGGGGEQGRVRE